jgi:RecJ-like exonuclease
MNYRVLDRFADYDRAARDAAAMRAAHPDGRVGDLTEMLGTVEPQREGPQLSRAQRRQLERQRRKAEKRSRRVA